MKHGSLSVIIDTNVWIGFLIGKRLSSLHQSLSTNQIHLVTSPQLLLEIKLVTQREKLKKYFPQKSVDELIALLELIATTYYPEPIHQICNDPADNFLLDLIDASKANYLVTGDKNLLQLNPFKTAEIVSPAEFETMLRHISG